MLYEEPIITFKLVNKPNN